MENLKAKIGTNNMGYERATLKKKLRKKQCWNVSKSILHKYMVVEGTKFPCKSIHKVTLRLPIEQQQNQ